MRSATASLRGAASRAPWLAAALALAATAAAAEQPPAVAAKPIPTRIVSLNLCTDQLLIALADAQRIAAVSGLAGNPALSVVAAAARTLPTTRGDAEDVLRRNPDLVLAGPILTPTALLLQRAGVAVIVVPLAADLDGVRRAVRLVASAVGAAARGEAMIADFDARLAGMPAAAPAPTAVVYEIGGRVLGRGSLADAVLAAAGFRNAADGYRLSRGGEVPLETLVLTPPDVLVLASEEGEYRSVVADNLRHPVLNILRATRPVLVLPWRYWLCGTPHIAEAIAALADWRLRLDTAQGRPQ
jgi:iron complex transport system substrate-binding protein